MKSNLFGQYVVGFASNQEGDVPHLIVLNESQMTNAQTD